MAASDIRPPQDLIDYAEAQFKNRPNLSADDLYLEMLKRIDDGPSALRAAAGASIAVDPGLVYGLLVATVLWPFIIVRDAIAARRRESRQEEVEAAIRLVAPERCRDWSAPRKTASVRRGPKWVRWMLMGLIAWAVLFLIFLGIILLFVS